MLDAFDPPFLCLCNFILYRRKMGHILINIYTHTHTYTHRLIGLVGRVFANGLGDQGSIPGQVIPKTFKKWYLISPFLTLSIIKYVPR